MLPARVSDIAAPTGAGSAWKSSKSARKNARKFLDGASKMGQNAHRGIFVRWRRTALGEGDTTEEQLTAQCVVTHATRTTPHRSHVDRSRAARACPDRSSVHMSRRCAARALAPTPPPVACARLHRGAPVALCSLRATEQRISVARFAPRAALTATCHDRFASRGCHGTHLGTGGGGHLSSWRPS